MPAAMTRDEKKVLIAICRYIVNSDGVVTAEEINAMNQIAAEMGIVDYEEILNEVDNEITSIDDLHKRIDLIKDSRNLKRIIQCSIRLSRVDANITYDEMEILVYAADAWGIDIKAVMCKC